MGAPLLYIIYYKGGEDLCWGDNESLLAAGLTVHQVGDRPDEHLGKGQEEVGGGGGRWTDPRLEIQGEGGSVSVQDTSLTYQPDVPGTKLSFVPASSLVTIITILMIY